MNVPAGAEQIWDSRARHEGDVITKATADLLEGVAEQQRVVCSGEPVLRLEGEFNLARAPFILDSRERQAQLEEMISQ